MSKQLIYKSLKGFFLYGKTNVTYKATIGDLTKCFVKVN